MGWCSASICMKVGHSVSEIEEVLNEIISGKQVHLVSEMVELVNEMIEFDSIRYRAQCDTYIVSHWDLYPKCVLWGEPI